MYVTPEQIAAANKAGVEAMIGFCSTQFSAIERLSALQFNAAKAAFEDSVSHVKSLAGAKDVQEFISLSTAAAQPSLEKAVAFSRSVYEVAAQSQGEVSKFFEAQTAEANKALASTLDKVTKNAPAGSDVAVAAVKSALAAANSAYDSMSKVAKQASELAEANFAAVTATSRESSKRKSAAV